MELFNLLLDVFLLLSSLPEIFAAYITFPLYIGPSPSAWAPLYNAIASNPRLVFQLIINPNSGPGSTQYPSSAYITALAKLRKYSNVQLIGYIHISYCRRSLSDVENDVSLYAGWSTYTAANIRLDGIFFDETPGSYATSDFYYLANVTKYARVAFSGGHLSFNPGVVCDSRYFPLVDNVNVFESPYSSFNARTTLISIPSAERSKSTIMIYSFTGNQNQETSLVTTIARSGISGMYITTTGGYVSFSKYWTQFVADIGATA
jgi:Spherulation-specific family 4